MKFAGLNSHRRQQLATILGSTRNVITIDNACVALNMDRKQTGDLLSSLHRSGWLKLISPGFYAPVQLDATTSDGVVENPVVVASYVFDKCYIGAWSAASHWDLTDQLFLKTWVFTQNRVRNRIVTKGGNSFILFHEKSSHFIGLKTEWFGVDKVMFSDPHRTLVDFANHIDELGLRSFIDIFEAYLNFGSKDFHKVLSYAFHLENRTLFKRFGFMLERYLPEEKELINQCRHSISKGPSLLAPRSECDFYVKKWKLKVPSYLVKHDIKKRAHN